jgi:hypothetical protein
MTLPKREPKPGGQGRGAPSPPPAADSHQPVRSPVELFEVLWRLHLEAMRGGSYEAAYHILAAALHCAERAGSVTFVGSVKGIAGLHQEEIDALVPPNVHSTAAAQARGTIPVFTSLEATAQAMAVRMRADRALKSSRAGREPSR